MTRIYLFAFALAASLTLGVYPSHAQQKAVVLTKRDRAAIVSSILQREDLLKRDLSVGEVAGELNISTENISATPLPKIKGLSFVPLSPAEIRERVQTGFLYYKFGRFQIRGSKIRVTFGHYFENVEGQAGYSGGLTYEYRKVGGKWLGTEVSGWGSTS